MKKGQMILIGICALSLCIVIGIFLGRNLPGHYVLPAQNAVTIDDKLSKIADSNHTAEGPLDLNTATQSQLMELPGIGEVLAQRILDYRQAQGLFHTPEDLLNVDGIGENKLEQIKPFIRVGG